MLLGQLAEAFGAGAGNRLGQVEFRHRFVLAEIGAVVQFLQQDQPGAPRLAASATRASITVRLASASPWFFSWIRATGRILRVMGNRCGAS